VVYSLLQLVLIVSSLMVGMLCAGCVIQVSPCEESLNEMYERFGFSRTRPAEEVKEELKDKEQKLRKAIQMELKMKEGAEAMRRAYGDRRSAANVGSIIKDSASRFDEFSQELQEVQTFLLMMEDISSSAVPTSGPHGF